MANPLVNKHLVYVPELAQNATINRLSQSRKWRERLDPDLRVQMVSCGSKQWYLHEPIQLDNKKIVIPQFFYQSNGCLLSKCVLVTLSPLDEEGRTTIEFPAECSFDSVDVFVVPVNDFVKGLDDILYNDGTQLKNICGTEMYSEPFN